MNSEADRDDQGHGQTSAQASLVGSIERPPSSLPDEQTHWHAYLVDVERTLSAFAAGRWSRDKPAAARKRRS